MERSQLDQLDARGVDSLVALARSREPRSGSHASPHPFICSDGRTYWVKRNAQQGLVAELVAGRVAELAHAGPPARIIEVPRAALPSDGTADHLEGVGVGSLDP